MILAAASAVSASAAPPAPPEPSPSARRLIGEAPLAPGAEGNGPLRIRLDKALGAGDFAIGLSLRADGPAAKDLGDLASLWDPAKRQGFTLGLRNNTGCTSSQPNWRQLQFGIDAGTEPTWREEGRPGSALLGFALCVHQGSLYVGTCEPGPGQVGKVYRYAGPGRWEDLGKLDGANSVTALASHGGRLYAGTGKYLLRGSSLPDSENQARGGRIHRLGDDGRWELVGDLDPTEAVGGLVHYAGKLYASSLYKPAGFFRYEEDGKWASLPTPGGKRVEALGVHGGYLYASTYDSGAVYRFDGTTWADLGLAGAENTQTYAFATYQDRLHVGTWPSGKVYRLDPEDRWADAGRIGGELEVMGMLVHNGAFYSGSLPKGEAYRYEGGTSWKLLKQLDETPDVRYRRVWAMATYQGRLFMTTLPSGNTWSMEAGSCVSDDRELGAGWHDVVAQRAGGRLRLFVDGKLAAESAADTAGLSLDTGGLDLVIGEGPRGRFPGEIRNAWIDRAP